MTSETQGRSSRVMMVAGALVVLLATGLAAVLSSAGTSGPDRGTPHPACATPELVTKNQCRTVTRKHGLGQSQKRTFAIPTDRPHPRCATAEQVKESKCREVIRYTLVKDEFAPASKYKSGPVIQMLPPPFEPDVAFYGAPKAPW